MRFAVDRRSLITAGFAAALAILAAIALSSYRSIYRYQETARSVEHTYKVLTKIEEVLSHVKDIALGQRGYVITGEYPFLRLFDRAVEELGTDIELLKWLTADNPRQQKNVAAVEALVQEIRATAQSSITLKPRQLELGNDAQVALVNASSNKLDEVRQLIEEMTRNEAHLLSIRSREAEASARISIYLLVFGGLASFFLLFVAFGLLRREVNERGRAQDSLRQSNAFLDSVIENIPNMIFVKDARDLKFVRLNKAGEELLGYSRAQLLGRNDFDFFPEEQARFLVANDREVLAGRKLIDIPEERVHSRNKGARILHTKKIPICDEHGEPLNLLGISEDITETKQAQQRLEAQHAVTRVLAESSTLGEATPKILQALCECMQWEVGTIWNVDRDAGALRCVELWCSPATRIPKFEALTREMTYAPGAGTAGRVWQSGEPLWVSNLIADPNYPRGRVGIEYGLTGAFGFPIRAGGEILGVIDFFGSVMPKPDGELMEMFAAIGSQVGQFMVRKQAEEAVRQSERDLRLLQAATLAIGQAEDSLSALTTLLEKVCEFTGWAYGQIWLPDNESARLRIGPAWYSRNPRFEQFRRANEALSFAPKEGLLERVWSTHEPAWVWDLAPDPNRARRPMILEARFQSWIGIPVLADGEVIAVIEFFETERHERSERALRLISIMAVQLGPVIRRKRAEEEIRRLNAQLQNRAAELETANKELESFSYSVSHDLRSPLRAVSGYSQMLEEDFGGALDDEGRRLLKVIRDNSQKMGMLIDDLLTFSRLGRQSIAALRMEMEPLVREVLNDLATTSGTHAPQWLIGRLPQARGDRALLKQVWVNLLSNALKFSSGRDQPVIEVGGSIEGDQAVYYVKDNGVGFDMQYSNKLFGVFQRLHTAEEFPGTGVGLAIVQRVVNRHGGRVWAEAKPDQGAAFFFTLPRGGN
jgi:PAS domain S-box-containing protein